MLTTSHKDKIGKDWSYPLTLTDLWTALSDVPGFERFHLNFHGQNQRHNERNFYYILDIDYRYDNDMFADQSHWWIAVKAIPRTLRHEVRSQLITSVLPTMIKPWLLERADIDGRFGHARYLVVADKATGALKCRRYDGKIDPKRS